MELLVVIAIVGVIASIALVNLRGARKKAKLAKSMQFSQSVYQALGAYAVGVWSFERVEGGITPDITGYNNHCELKGGMDETNATTGIIRQALQFDGFDNYLDCGNGGSLDSPSITDEITVELWIKPFNKTDQQRIINKWHESYDARSYMLMISTSGLLDFIVSYDGEVNWNYGAFVSVDELELGAWHHLVGTFDTTNGTSLYINAKLKAVSSQKARGIYSTSTNLFIGGWYGVGYEFKGLIDEVRIYKEALTLGQIQKHYAEGLERLKLAEK